MTTIAGFFANEYNPFASHVSAMTLQDGIAHSLANAAALLSGGALVVFGISIWFLSQRLFSAGALCWILFGISMIANGIWPMGSPLHGLYIIGLFNVLAPALSLLDLKSETLRARLHKVTMFCSLASVCYLWILLNDFDPEGYSGLTQRVFGAINLFWPFSLALQVSQGRHEA